MIVGIDLGTTHSLIGIIEKGGARLFQNNGTNLIPSIVSFLSNENIRVGDKKLKSEKTKDTIYSSKRFIGKAKKDVEEWIKLLPFDFSGSTDQMIYFNVAERSYTPIEIASYILKYLKEIAEKELNKKVEGAVITVPAYFNDAQRQATKFAGELAGYEVKRILNEPTAACLAYGLDKKAFGNIAVFDLGGGTFDISILKVSDGVFEVLATNGNTALGGDDFDIEIAKHLIPNFDQLPKEEKGQILVLAEKVKRELSDSESTQFIWKNQTQIITRNDFEAWISPILEKVVEPCLSCLNDSKIKKGNISDVILVGGSTRIPLVQKKVEDLFGREPICTLNPDEVVAIGAAVQANILMGQTTDMLLLDVIPLSLGIETMGGVVTKIIHRNSTIPISASEHFSTYIDGQVSVDIHVVQGERELVKDCRSLARFQLKDLPPLPAGIPKIEVEFIIDANGILNVKAQELRTQKHASIQVKPSYGLSDEQVEKMLMDSFEFAEKDFETRFLIEAKVEGEALVRATQKSFEKGKNFISTDEQNLILQSLKELETSLTSENRDQIKKATERLNQTTQNLAEKILNHAVSEALKNKEL